MTKNSFDTKAELADGLLKSLPYTCAKILDLTEKLKIVAQDLRGTIKSPAIRSKEEAAYQRGTVIYRNDIVDLLSQEEALSKELSHFLWEYHRIEKAVQQLDPYEVELLSYRYENRFTISAIAGMEFMSTKTAWKKIECALEKIADAL